MQALIKILRGVVIGIANIIPGVSGGTLMVAIGVYDTLIHSITHLFKEFKKSVLDLLPYVIGMGIAIVGLSFVLEPLMENYPIPTAFSFVGLILGSLPMLLKEKKETKLKAIDVILFLLFFALVVGMKFMGSGFEKDIVLSFGEIIMLFIVGIIASATMIIPGVSGSMMLMLLGYYGPVIGAIKGLASSLAAMDISAALADLFILLPFGIGIVVGIFGVAKLIEMLFAKFKGPTLAAVLGLVIASPVALLIDKDFTQISLAGIIVSVITLAVGYFVAWIFGRLDDKKQ